MKKKIIVLISLLLSCTIFTGCLDIKYYEEIGFILTAAVEYDNGSLQGTYLLPAVDAQNKGKDEVEILDVDDIKSMRDGRQKSRLSSQKRTEAGKIQQVLLSRDLAEKGIGNLLQIFERDTSNPNQSYVIIVDGSPREMLNKLHEIPEKPRISFYINELIKNNIKDSNIPETRLYNVGINKYAEYIDIMAPVIKGSKNGVSVAGTALFSETKMTGFIDVKDSLLLLAMMNKFKTGEYTLPPLPGEPDLPQPNHGLVFKIRDSKSKIKVKIVDNIPTVDIKVKMDCVLDEKSLNEPMDKKLQAKIEKHISDELQKRCTSVLAYTKEVGSDPIGIGNLFRAKYNEHFKKNPWSCKKIKYNVTVSANLRNFGLFR